jgi:hypothetical protein
MRYYQNVIADQHFFETAPDGLYVCYTPISFPMNFFIHTYIVAKVDGEINRYDMYREGDGSREDGYVFKNILPAWEGCHVFYKRSANDPGRLFTCKVLAAYTMDEQPNIDTVTQQLESIYTQYPRKHQYHYMGPNSNSYTKWLLQELRIDLELPFAAWG